MKHAAARRRNQVRRDAEAYVLRALRENPDGLTQDEMVAQAPRALRYVVSICIPDLETSQAIIRSWGRFFLLTGIPYTRPYDSGPGSPGAPSWKATRFAQDPAARDFVDLHPNGATLEEIGATMGLTRQRVQQLLELGLRKVRARW